MAFPFFGGEGLGLKYLGVKFVSGLVKKLGLLHGLPSEGKGALIFYCKHLSALAL